MGSSGRAINGFVLLLLLALINNMAYAHHESAVSVDVVGGEQVMVLNSLQPGTGGGAMHPTHPGKLPFCSGRVWVSVNATELLQHDNCTDGGHHHHHPGRVRAPDCLSNWMGKGYEVSLEEFKGGRGESASAMLGRWRRERDGEDDGSSTCAWVEIPTHTGDKVMLCVRCEEEQATMDREGDEEVVTSPAPAPLGHGSRPLGREVSRAQLARFRIRIKIKIKVEIRIFRN